MLTVLILAALAAPAQAKEQDVVKVKAALPETAPAKPKKARKLLVYSKTHGFRHGSIALGAETLKLMGEKTGAFTATHTEDPAMFDEKSLSQYDGVFFLNTTGDCLATVKGKQTPEEEPVFQKRKANLLKFVSEGKGFAGNHAATDTFYSWPEYGALVGAWFTSHPWGGGPVKVEDARHPLTAMFDAAGFDFKDETYLFGERKGNQPYSRAKLRVLLSIDMSKPFKGGHRPDDDYAISWIHEQGKGRVFYCSFGHGENVYQHPQMLKHYLAGIQYALGDLAADATPSGPLKAK